MVAAIAEVTEDCEEPQLDWKTVASIDHVGSTWFMRCHGARMVHLQQLQEHRVYEELDFPPGVKSLSVRWVDKDDYSTAKARLTARGQEQELTGQENFHSATPRSATLRRLLWWLGIALKLSSKAPILEKRDVWVTLPVGSGSGTWGEHGVCSRHCQALRADQLHGRHHATKVKEELYGLTPECARPVRAQQHA